jgi:hypothetical protein
LESMEYGTPPLGFRTGRFRIAVTGPSACRALQD